MVPSNTFRAQAAADPFTRLRSDGIWTLNADVPMDRVTPLTTHNVMSRLVPAVEHPLGDPDLVVSGTAASPASLLRAVTDRGPTAVPLRSDDLTI